MRSKLRILAIVIILAGMPAFAWYFLEKGTNLRKSAMRALVIKSSIGQFEIPSEKDYIIRPDSLKGRRWLIAILGDKESRIKNSQQLLNLYKQSKDEFHTNILSIIGLENGEAMPLTSQNLKLPSDDKNWLICYMASDHVYPFCKEAFNLESAYQNKPCIILVDENLMIRNYYLFNDEREFKNLVRHYPVFLSLKNKVEDPK
ncbi:MAG: hypothetical protein ABIO44_12255 [Saprospiraceae bacterium]